MTALFKVDEKRTMFQKESLVVRTESADIKLPPGHPDVTLTYQVDYDILGLRAPPRSSWDLLF
jgi:hypothetical protein